MKKLNYDDFCDMYFILTEVKDRGSRFYEFHKIEHMKDYLRWYFMKYLGVYCNADIVLKTQIAFSEKDSKLVRDNVCNEEEFLDHKFDLDFKYAYDCYLVYLKNIDSSNLISNLFIFSTDFVNSNLTFAQFLKEAALSYPDHIIGCGEFEMFEFDVIVGKYNLKEYALPDVDMKNAKNVIKSIRKKLKMAGINKTELKVFGVEGVCSGAAGRERTRCVVEQLSNFELDVLTRWIYDQDFAGGCTGRDIIVATNLNKISSDLKIGQAIFAVREEKAVGQRVDFTVVPPWYWIYAVRVNRGLGNNES